jgi:hypothetical protein
MVSYGTGNPTENRFLIPYHSSFMVHWWVLFHCDHSCNSYLFTDRVLAHYLWALFSLKFDGARSKIKLRMMCILFEVA